jgi:hypothetical protein
MHPMRLPLRIRRHLARRGVPPTRKPLSTRRTAPIATHAPIATYRVARPLSAALLGVTAMVLACSCGSSGGGLIPSASAGPLKSDFEAVARAAKAGNGNCTETQEAIVKTEQDFLGLPASVDPGLREALGKGIANLSSRARALCTQPLSPSTTATSTATTTTSSSSTTHTSTPSTSTTTSSTTTSTLSTPTTSSTTSTTTAVTSAPGGGVQAPGEAGGVQGNANPSEGGVGEAAGGANGGQGAAK